MKKPALLALLLLLAGAAGAQYASLYPSNWYVGMKWNKVQVIVKGDYDGFSKEKVVVNYPGVQLLKVHKFENGKYLALDLQITANARPGNVVIEFIANNAGKMGMTQTGALPTETIKMAVVVVATLPILIAYPFFQKYFIGGLTVGAVKE